MRYAIWAPPYRHQSGGIRALYVLCQQLCKRGHDASIVPMFSEWASNPHEAVLYDHTNPAPALHVYPEIIVDNPANASCVRWLLNKADATGTCFGWVPSMGYPVLHVPIIDPTVFYPRTSKRHGVGVWQGKGVVDEARIPPGATRIRNHTPEHPHDLAELLGSFEYVISFDAFSSINTEAAMCGTPVRIHTNDMWTVDELHANPFEPPIGWAFTDADLEAAQAVVTNAHAAYTEQIPHALATVDYFIDATTRMPL